MNVLSIQSHVAYGHVGNASATFPMQRLGVEVWPIHTVQFSNHTGYGAWRGQVFEAGLIADLVEGIAERGVLPSCDAVLSGYMGSHETGEAILGAVARVKAANPAALYACDPVIGDVGRGIFVRPGIPEFMRDRAVPSADIVTPNLFELEYLAGRSINSVPDLQEALLRLHARGPRLVLVTSLATQETPAEALDLVASSGQGLFRLRTPRLEANVNGLGDAIAALFLVHVLREQDPARALQLAGSSVFGLLRQTVEAGSREILTIAAQDEFVHPGQLFPVERIA
ncbi:MAG: pyridoxal kinase PdxY [Beijerinckiaceae bacterium]|nr:pyridoxal kinase PdxY [Beijerinckiaceae bacterium]